MTFGRVALHAGENTVTIGCDWGCLDVDSILLEPAPAPVPFRLADKPVTAGASPEACRLLATLDRYFGKQVIAGQQDEHGSRLDYIATESGGKAPAILGLDLLYYSGAFGKPEGDGQIERARDWVLQRHGIVTISWHWFSPFGATDQVWNSFNTKKTTFDASRVADEKSAEYQAMVRDIDRIAVKLEVLRDAHVPVLWRPLHEAEGKWFWWGAKGPETTRRIYRLMFDRFTRVYGLNNLIWVWTTTDDPDALEWYPGDDVVDIVGADVYPPAGEHGTFLSTFDNLRQLYRGRKPIALCETNGVPDPADLARDGAGWMWFLVWDDYISRPEANPAALVSRIYRDGGVVTLDELGK
jgi:mannan endo-1,4-beta-mannosidase